MIPGAHDLQNPGMLKYFGHYFKESGVPVPGCFKGEGSVAHCLLGPLPPLVWVITTDATAGDKKLSASLKCWRSFYNSFWHSKEETSLQSPSPPAAALIEVKGETL